MYLLYENENKNQGKHSPFLKDIHIFNQKIKIIIENVRYNIIFCTETCNGTNFIMVQNYTSHATQYKI